MPLRDEQTFTEDELFLALEFLLPPDHARRVARDVRSIPEITCWDSITPEELAASPVKGPRSMDGDLLDLLTLVSDDCARRAWRLMSLSDAQGAERRSAFLRQTASALRKPPAFSAGGDAR